MKTSIDATVRHFGLVSTLGFGAGHPAKRSVTLDQVQREFPSAPAERPPDSAPAAAGVAAQDQITVDLLDPRAGADVTSAAELSDLVNDVYAVAEEGIWVDGATRTTPDEMRSFIAAGEILVARSGEGRIVGSVRLHDVAADAAEFGILVAARDQRNLGIGRTLLDHIEQRGRNRGRQAVQLELLVPSDWRRPSKEFLLAWYGRRGYRLVGTAAFEDNYPHLAPLLATPCDLQIHRKVLS
jgi:GNAT superfamily N-acetyltransferase